MHSSTLLASALLSTLTTAFPTTLNQATSYTNSDDCGLSSFYLVTTSSPSKSIESSLLPNVSATSLFDPFYGTTNYIRTIAPGYNSLPTFNLTDGQLQTLTQGPHNGPEEFLLNSTALTSNSTLGLVQAAASKGKWQLELLEGYLLNVRSGANHSGTGWTLCEGEEGETVIYWQGTEASCVPVFVQAVSSPPY